MMTAASFIAGKTYTSDSSASSLLLKNVEALGQNENVSGNKSCHCTATYYGSSYGPTIPYTFCGTCEDGEIHVVSNPSTC